MIKRLILILAILASVNAGAQTFTGQVFSGATNAIYVSAVNGNDSTAKRGGLLPFLTLSNAVVNAQYGDVIFVEPGTYNPGTNLAKNGVTWYFSGPSCVLSNFSSNAIPSTTNSMFTDIYGATNFTVLGSPTIIYNTGTEPNNQNGGSWTPDDPNFPYSGTGLPSGSGATNAFYSIVYTTNSNTVANLNFSSCQIWSWETQTADPFGVGPSMFYTKGCSNVVINCTQMIEPSYGTAITYTNGGGPNPITGTASGFIWGLGEAHLRATHIYSFDAYGLWADEPGSPYTNAVYVDVDELNSEYYSAATDNTYRNWINIPWINAGTPSAGTEIEILGGFNYITSQKISATNGNLIGISSGELWVTAQKLETTAGNSYISVSSTGSIVGNIGQYSGPATSASTISIAGTGTSELFGQYSTNVNGNGITNLQAASLSGQIPSANATNFVLLNGNQSIAGGKTFSTGTTNVSAIGFVGNASGLTNVHISPLIIASNWTSAFTNSNTSSYPIQVSTSVAITTAAVTGDASISLFSTGLGGTTNTFATSTTVAVSLAQTLTNQLSVWVTNGGTYGIVTNLTSGTGNKAAPVGNTGQLIQY